MVLLHPEIQGKKRGNLAFRMFHYKALIFVMHKRPMTALAIKAETLYRKHPQRRRGTMGGRGLHADHNSGTRRANLHPPRGVPRRGGGSGLDLFNIYI